MAAITFSSDGTALFVAAEYATTGNQAGLMASIEDLNLWTLAYNPGAGSAVNVLASVGNSDIIYFYGNFGSNIGLIEHTISTGANVDITPPTIGINIINTLAVNPTPLSDGNFELLCRVETTNQLLHSNDTGTTWVIWDATGTGSGTAIEAIWQGNYYPDGYLIGVGGSVFLSPNEGVSTADVTGTISALGICGLQWVTE